MATQDVTCVWNEIDVDAIWSYSHDTRDEQGDDIVEDHKFSYKGVDLPIGLVEWILCDDAAMEQINRLLRESVK